MAVFTLALLVWASGGRISAQPEAEAEAAKPPEAGKAAEAGDQPAAAEPVVDASSDPTELIEAARKRLVGYKSIKARLVEAVALGDRRFRASGSYLQGTNLKLRLEYQVTVGATEASLLEVCDGYVLWSRHTIAGRPRITRRDVRQILNAATATPKSMEAMLIAELGLGGLPALMASIQCATRRSTAKPSKWSREAGAASFSTGGRRRIRGRRGSCPRIFPTGCESI